MTIVIAATLLSFFFVEILALHRKLTFLDRKPFNCVPCFAAWSACILYFLPGSVTNFTLVMFGAGCLAPLYKQLMYKLYKILF